MNEALGFSKAAFGLASGLFFIGYLILEVPSNLALHRFGARRWIARIMVSWGIVASVMAFVPNAGTMYALRFLLGIAPDSSQWPCARRPPGRRGGRGDRPGRAHLTDRPTALCRRQPDGATRSSPRWRRAARMDACPS